MLEHWRRWLVAILLIILFAGAMQLGWLDFLTAKEPCLTSYKLPMPQVTAVDLAGVIGLNPNEITNGGYLIDNGDVLIWISVGQDSMATRVCFTGNQTQPTPTYPDLQYRAEATPPT